VTADWRQPAEWRRHAACWLAWPSHPEEWPGELDGARRAVAEMAVALAPDEQVEMLVLPGESQESARQALAGAPVRFRDIPFGDVWLRDTGPVFTVNPAGQLGAACFRWTGWGGKYLFPHDPELSARIASECGAVIGRFDLACEGGALEVDGEGTVLTTRQCLLDPGRNPGADQAMVERVLADAIGARTVLWLERGLENDHTDGHIDTLARFTAPGRVVCMAPSGPADPNRAVLMEIRSALRAMRDAEGRALDVVELPSPSRIENRAGELLAASYLNFYIGNRTVVVPVYGAPADKEALEVLARLFPDRTITGIDARAVVTGGGAFHCISQQQPEVPLS
jgi:agmatine deiminase